MPWKLIGFVFLLVLVTIFIGSNLDHRCDISIGFTTFKEVPIFLSLLVSFVVGVLVMAPFAFFKPNITNKKKNVESEPNKAETSEQNTSRKNANKLGNK